MEVHSNDMVCSGAREQVCNESTSLRDPLTIANLGLENRRLCGRYSHETICCSIGRSMLSVEVCRLLGLVGFARVDSFRALHSVLFDRARRVGGTGVALFHFHATELVL